jgi:carbon-monoxide dehydrogenase large subunit
MGIGLHAHQTGGSTEERSEVRALKDGRIRVRTGMQDSGQGHQTALSAIAAETLGLTADQVIVEQGDSSWLEKGGGTGGSNLLPIAAPTMVRAALLMVDKAKNLAAEILETAGADIEYASGTFTVAGTDRRVSFAEIAARFPEVPADAGVQEPGAGCVGELDFEGQHATFPNGCYIAEVELDPDTGKVRLDRFSGIDDLGRLISPAMADGQIVGGAVQGIAEVMFEGAVYDRDSGQLMNGSLMDYHIPRADEIPSMPIEWLETPSPNNPLSVKGAGEVGTIGAPAAVFNAVHDALRPLGVVHVDMPLTPQKVWQAIQTAGKA